MASRNCCVRYAQDGEPLPSLGHPGVVMAPPGFHLVVEQRKAQAHFRSGAEFLPAVGRCACSNRLPKIAVVRRPRAF